MHMCCAHTCLIGWWHAGSMAVPDLGQGDSAIRKVHLKWHSVSLLLLLMLLSDTGLTLTCVFLSVFNTARKILLEASFPPKFKT